jgi:hypothetical protein
MLHRRSETLATEFLEVALALGALGVPELEARARAAGLLGARQSISHIRRGLWGALDLGEIPVRAAAVCRRRVIE